MSLKYISKSHSGNRSRVLLATQNSNPRAKFCMERVRIPHFHFLAQWQPLGLRWFLTVHVGTPAPSLTCHGLGVCRANVTLLGLTHILLGLDMAYRDRSATLSICFEHMNMIMTFDRKASCGKKNSEWANACWRSVSVGTSPTLQLERRPDAELSIGQVPHLYPNDIVRFQNQRDCQFTIDGVEDKMLQENWINPMITRPLTKC